MARTYATIDAGIWLDPEFCALSAGAQRTYFMLITQTDITACGSLALTLRRWSKTCAEQDLKAWLEELAGHRFVLIDEDTEELLVRTFAKWDGGYKHAKRVLAVTATAKAILSVPLREAVAKELAMLGVSIGIPVPSDSDSEAIESRRSVVTEVGNECTPETTLQEREPEPLDSVEPPAEFCSKHPKGTDAPCGPCKTARLRYAAWTKTTAGRESAARAAAIKARESCSRCHGSGWLEDDAGTPTRKCDHRIAS
jgi:hypothetical protein